MPSRSCNSPGVWQMSIVITIVTTDKHALELEKTMRTTDLTSERTPLRILGLRDQKSLDLSHVGWSIHIRKVPEEERNVIRLLEEAVRDVGSPQALKLRGVHPAAPPVCILHDLFVSWAQEAAKKLRIEKHLLYVSPATPLSCDLQADVILVNTFYAAEKPVLDALRNEVIGTPDIQARHIFGIGPLLPESYVNDETDGIPQQESEERDPCILWLNTRPPDSVLNISFGSFATHSAPQLLELAQGLEASGCSFLWLVRSPDAPDVSAASGASESLTEFLPPGFHERVKDRGMCYSGWAPQMRILKHSAVGGFLSHCGWNSVLEALCAGIPMLTWPITAEQHLNRRLLVDHLKAAIELKANPYTKEDLGSDEARPVEFVSKEEIARKASTLMEEPEGRFVRENIQKLRAEVRDAGAPGSSSRRDFEVYVHHLHSK